MSILKRLSTTLFTRIDKVVGEIENHDAVIQATLVEMRKRIAEAKVRLNQVYRDQDSLKTQIKQQTENFQLWQRRAVESANGDEKLALECVARSKQCKQKNNSLTDSLKQLASMSIKLAADIETSEQRLSSMKQKLTLMRARESTSSALQSTSTENLDTNEFIDDTFDRWEINISQVEMVTDTTDLVDCMEHEFVTHETQIQLKNELTALLDKESSK